MGAAASLFYEKPKIHVFLDALGENQVENLIKHLVIVMNFCHLNDELTPNSHVHKSFKFLHDLQNEYRRNYDNKWPEFFECNFTTPPSTIFKIRYSQCQRLLLFGIQDYYGKDKTKNIILNTLI